MTTPAPEGAAEAAAEPVVVPTAPRHPLSLPHFRNLWLGATISLLGDQFYLVALPWLVLQLTGSSVALGAILMTAEIPRAALMLVGGAVTDPHGARRHGGGVALAQGGQALAALRPDVRLRRGRRLSFPAGSALKRL